MSLDGAVEPARRIPERDVPLSAPPDKPSNRDYVFDSSVCHHARHERTRDETRAPRTGRALPPPDRARPVGGAGPDRAVRRARPCSCCCASGPATATSSCELVPEIAQQERRVDLGNLYRALRGLKEEGVVSSEWEAGQPGPARRTYALTDAGRRLLDDWAQRWPGPGHRRRLPRPLRAERG